MPVHIPAMKIDVLGRIRNMQVPVQHAFHPVFEAVVNSIHATEERFGDAVAAEGRIEVHVHRVQQPELPGVPGRPPIPAVVGFIIVDNGGGFTDANLSAFETADTTAKAERGGKGVGRFTWLVVFDQAAITSTFRTDDGTNAVEPLHSVRLLPALTISRTRE